MIICALSTARECLSTIFFCIFIFRFRTMHESATRLFIDQLLHSNPRARLSLLIYLCSLYLKLFKTGVHKRFHHVTT